MTHYKNSDQTEVKKVHAGQQSFSCSNFYEKRYTKLKMVKSFASKFFKLYFGANMNNK